MNTVKFPKWHLREKHFTPRMSCNEGNYVRLQVRINAKDGIMIVQGENTP